jgi:hypothetical protein
MSEFWRANRRLSWRYSIYVRLVRIQGTPGVDEDDIILPQRHTDIREQPEGRTRRNSTIVNRIGG